MDKLAVSVRGADTNRLVTSPQSAKLIAALLAVSLICKNDSVQLNPKFRLYAAV